MSLVSIVGALARLLQDQTRLYRLQGPAELAPLLVETFALQAAVNTPWRLDVGAVAADCTLNLDGALGQPVSLLTRLADGGEHLHTGLLLGVHYGDTDGTLARYRLRLGPWLSLLAHTQRSQVWQERTVVEILDSVFAHYPAAAWRWAPCVAPHLAQSPQGADGLRSLCTQYRESDLVRMDILVNADAVDAFASIVHRTKAEGQGRAQLEDVHVPPDPSDENAPVLHLLGHLLRALRELLLLIVGDL